MSDDEGGGFRSKLKTLGEMRNYTVIWSGQVASLIGSGMTFFALMVLIFEDTGEVTSVSLLFFAAFGPSIILAPIAGVIIDRYNRKWIMAIADVIAALSTVGIMVLYMTDNLEFGYVLLLVAFGDIFRAFQFPAFSAATTLLVPKKHYGRAGGMLALGWSISEMAAPILGALLLSYIGLGGVLVVDIITFFVAIGTLLIIPIPEPKRNKEGTDAQASFWRDLTFGFRYIGDPKRKGLRGLLLVFFTSNFVGMMAWLVMQPMILTKTDGDEVILGTVMLLGGIGGLVGGAVISIWGGFKRKIKGLILGLIISNIGFLILGLDGWVPSWILGVFIMLLLGPLVFGASQAIWQSKVPPDLQGRVFSVRTFIALVGEGPAVIMAGPLADNVFEPFMMDATGPLETLFGSGPGAGMGLMIFIIGLFGMLIGVVAYFVKSIRNVEDDIPDHGLDSETIGQEGSEETPEEGTGEADEPGGFAEEGPDETRRELDVPLGDDEVH
jgi:DHA3 family macrolide efflux protein-like MFS transporter